MAKNARVLVPKNSVETKDDFVQVSVAESFDRVHLPVWQRRRERYSVGQTLRVLGDGLQQEKTKNLIKYWSIG
jgi:hypothetical protein